MSRNINDVSKASSVCNPQHSVGSVPDHCDVARMRICFSRLEAIAPYEIPADVCGEGELLNLTKYILTYDQELSGSDFNKKMVRYMDTRCRNDFPQLCVALR